MSVAVAAAVVFVVTGMLAVGLQASADELRRALVLRGFLGRALLANFVIIPALGLALIWLIPMAPPLRSAFILLACAPGGPSALQFTTKHRPALANAGALAVVLSVLSVVVSPFLMSVIALQFGVQLVVPRGLALGVVAVSLLLPLVVGIALRYRWPAIAGRIGHYALLVSTLAFLAFVFVVLEQRQVAIADLEWDALLALFGLIFVCMVIGWMAGGPNRAHRRVLATASSMRNVVLCLAIVRYTAPGAPVEVPLVAFSALMIPPNLIFYLLTVWRDRKVTANS
jgi:BASS family bile acid:Na+ symporter